MAAPGARPRRLTKRAEFLRAARGRRAGRPGFSLQAMRVENPEPGVGFTVTRKTGNAPERNRIKRRLREVVRNCADALAPSHDYVLVGRREALSLPFSALVADLRQLLSRVGADPSRDRRKNGQEPSG